MNHSQPVILSVGTFVSQGNYRTNWIREKDKGCCLWRMTDFRGHSELMRENEIVKLTRSTRIERCVRYMVSWPTALLLARWVFFCLCLCDGFLKRYYLNIPRHSHCVSVQQSQRFWQMLWSCRSITDDRITTWPFCERLFPFGECKVPSGNKWAPFGERKARFGNY